MSVRLVLVLAGLAVLASCLHATSSQPGFAGCPRITELIPGSGPAGIAEPTAVVVRGCGFARTGNRVTFGPVEIADIPARAGGSELRFLVPKELPATGEVPPLVLQSGRYPVTVTVPAARTNTVFFTLQ